MNHALVKYDQYSKYDPYPKYESKFFLAYKSYLTSMNHTILAKFKKVFDSYFGYESYFISMILTMKV
jgi:hypothetical protein